MIYSVKVLRKPLVSKKSTLLISEDYGYFKNLFNTQLNISKDLILHDTFCVSVEAD